MPKFIIDLWLDGYENEEEMKDACFEFIDDQLNMTASSIKMIGQIKEQEESKDTFILYGGPQEVVEKQLVCEHNWFGPCIDEINRFYKCTECFCYKYNCTWEDYLKYKRENNE